MTNHYTSYSVSKQLWEAGIALHKYPPAVFILPDGTIAPSDAEWEDGYPAYQAGELLRELPDEFELSKSEGVYYISVEIYVCEYRDRKVIAEATTVEDCAALALIELRKEKEDE